MGPTAIRQVIDGGEGAMETMRWIALSVLLTLFLATLSGVGSGQAQEPTPEPTSTETAGGLVQPGAEIERLAGGFQFTEGPAADADGGLYFSDVNASRIYHWSPDAGATLYRDNTQRTNGLHFDTQWRLVGCQAGLRRIIRDDLQGNIETVVDRYGATSFNAPNDVWIDPDGGIYFTDPNFRGMTTLSAVYLLPPDGGELLKVIDDLQLPNGVMGAPDGRLFIADYAGGIWQYQRNADGTLGEKTRISTRAGDGMTLDVRGNLYVAAGPDVLVFNPDGAQIEQLTPPETPANVTFGGADGRTLFITAGTSLYALAMVVRGMYVPVDGAMPTPAPKTPTALPSPTPAASETPAPTSSPTPVPTPTPASLYLPRAVTGRTGHP